MPGYHPEISYLYITVKATSFNYIRTAPYHTLSLISCELSQCCIYIQYGVSYSSLFDVTPQRFSPYDDDVFANSLQSGSGQYRPTHHVPNLTKEIQYKEIQYIRRNITTNHLAHNPSWCPQNTNANKNKETNHPIPNPHLQVLSTV